MTLLPSTVYGSVPLIAMLQKRSDGLLPTCQKLNDNNAVNCRLLSRLVRLEFPDQVSPLERYDVIATVLGVSRDAQPSLET